MGFTWPKSNNTKKNSREFARCQMNMLWDKINASQSIEYDWRASESLVKVIHFCATIVDLDVLVRNVLRFYLISHGRHRPKRKCKENKREKIALCIRKGFFECRAKCVCVPFFIVISLLFIRIGSIDLVSTLHVQQRFCVLFSSHDDC